MYDSWSAHFNEVREAVERFEKMEYRGQEFFFDVHSIENIFDFYVDKLQFNKAERIIEIGLRQHPEATVLRVKQAIIFIEKGRLSQATSLLENLLEIEKYNSEVYLNLGYVYLRDDHNKKAIAIFEEGFKYAFGNDVEVLLDVILYLNQFHEYHAVIDILEKRKAHFTTNENLLFELAYAYDKVEEDLKAYNTYQQVLDVNPWSDNAWYNSGITLVKMGDLESANEAFDFCLAINPEHSQAFFNKGNSLAQQNKYPEALDSYLECISLDIFQSRCLHYIADCWNQLGNSTMADNFFELATRIDPMDIDTWESYARFFMEQQEPESCRRVINLAMKEKEMMEDSELGMFYHIKAQSYVLNEEWDLSKKFFVKAILSNRRDLRHVIALFKLSKALKPNYNIELFVDEYSSKFMETASFHYILGAYHILITEDFGEAIKLLTEAVNFAPGYIEELMEAFPGIQPICQENPEIADFIEQNK
ncbi:tetratricopeptide repeat protein [Marinilabilia sp.]|uniref:tetratricopeptide repeat protein n=1 Tax=Marinilabilia sp. TaxID=2021252 RepID=UPI0025C5F79D|nr:tetratricopeptide repeat protein [Marinilabilia sp.]